LFQACTPCRKMSSCSWFVMRASPLKSFSLPLDLLQKPFCHRDHREKKSLKAFLKRLCGKALFFTYTRALLNFVNYKT
jgi:hypothetical protein